MSVQSVLQQLFKDLGTGSLIQDVQMYQAAKSGINPQTVQGNIVNIPSDVVNTASAVEQSIINPLILPLGLIAVILFLWKK